MGPLRARAVGRSDPARPDHSTYLSSETQTQAGIFVSGGPSDPPDVGGTTNDELVGVGDAKGGQISTAISEEERWAMALVKNALGLRGVPTEVQKRARESGRALGSIESARCDLFSRLPRISTVGAKSQLPGGWDDALPVQIESSGRQPLR